jgi:hypothetical protein
VLGKFKDVIESKYRKHMNEEEQKFHKMIYDYEQKLGEYKNIISEIAHPLKPNPEIGSRKQENVGKRKFRKENKLTTKKQMIEEKENTSDIRDYCEAMDSEYENDIITKITPIKNASGRYVVDIEKVLKDLAMVKDALFAIFQKSSQILI